MREFSDEWWEELKQEWKDKLLKKFGTYSNDAATAPRSAGDTFIAVGDIDKLLEHIWQQLDHRRLY